MKTSFLWRLTSLAVLLAMVISPFGFRPAAPINTEPAVRQPGIGSIDATFVGISQPLRALAPIKFDSNAPSVLSKLQDRLAIPKTRNGVNHG